MNNITIQKNKKYYHNTKLPNDFFKNLFEYEINFDKNPDILILKDILLLYKVFINLLAWDRILFRKMCRKVKSFDN
jgi:hypothetical protein